MLADMSHKRKKQPFANFTHMITSARGTTCRLVGFPNSMKRCAKIKEEKKQRKSENENGKEGTRKTKSNGEEWKGQKRPGTPLIN